MSKPVIPFRRIKHGDPDKLKVLVEDLQSAKKLALPFAVLVTIAAGGAFIGAYLLG